MWKSGMNLDVKYPGPIEVSTNTFWVERRNKKPGRGKQEHGTQQTTPEVFRDAHQEGSRCCCSCCKLAAAHHLSQKEATECCTSMNDIRLMARTVERQKERRNVLYSFLIMRKPLTPGICVGNARFVQQPAYVTLEDLLVSKLSQKCISFHCDLFSIFVVSPCYMLGNRDKINTNTSLSQAFTTFLGGQRISMSDECAGRFEDMPVMQKEYTHMYTCTYKYIYTHICTHNAYIYTHKYTQIHKHTYANVQSDKCRVCSDTAILFQCVHIRASLVLGRWQILRGTHKGPLMGYLTFILF